MGNHLDGFCSQIGLDSGSCVNECIVSVPKCVLRSQNGHLQPENLHEHGQGLCDVSCIDGLLLVHIFGVVELHHVNDEEDNV